MYRYKGFNTAQVGGDLGRLEVVVNEWMQTHRPRIRLLAQSPHGDQILLSFVYEEPSETDERAARKVAVPEVFERNLDADELDPADSDNPGLPEAELPY